MPINTVVPVSIENNLTQPPTNITAMSTILPSNSSNICSTTTTPVNNDNDGLKISFEKQPNTRLSQLHDQPLSPGRRSR